MSSKDFPEVESDALSRNPGSGEGGLYIVATPIGNLGDITWRAVEILRQVEVIACEDTRHTRVLLSHLQIQGKRLLSYFEHNELRRTGQILDILKSGTDVALVSDAGTPTISDPGYRVVSECVKAGINVVPIPGPCAAIAALAASGLPTDRFLFIGFPPVKQGRLAAAMDEAVVEGRTAIMYTPLRRLPKLLELLKEKAPSATVVISRELTKLHEQFVRGTPEDLLSRLDRISMKGECTLLVCNQKPGKALLD